MTASEQFDAINVPEYLGEAKAKINLVRSKMGEGSFSVSGWFTFELFGVPHQARIADSGNELEMRVGDRGSGQDNDRYLYVFQAPINWLLDPLP